MWWTVPAQDMLLCNLPGAGGPGRAEPQPKDQREPPTAGRTPGTVQWHTRPHDTPQPITNQHGGKDEKRENKLIRTREKTSERQKAERRTKKR